MMRREPQVKQRSVALAGVDVDVLVGVLAVAVNDVFAAEHLVVV